MFVFILSSSPLGELRVERMNTRDPGMKPLAVSVKTGRALIGVGHTKIWELIKDGRLETFRIGRKRLIVYASLEKLVNRPKED